MAAHDIAIPEMPARPETPAGLDALRRDVARIERAHGRRMAEPRLSMGVAEIDARLGGGLALGALHEVAGAGPEAEHAASAGLLVAGLLGRTQGPVLWVMEQRDLFPPALAGAGLHPDRVVYVEAGRQEGVLAAMEDALRYRDQAGARLAGVVGEFRGRLGLTASRRLQLAAESAGVIAFALRRSRRARNVDEPPPMQDGRETLEPNAAVTRWRVACQPCAPPLPHRPDWPGLGPPRWRLDLMRRRGGAPAAWIVEVADAPHRLRLAAELADRPHPQIAGGRRAAA